MDLSEISNLIQIRSYMAQAIQNYGIKKEVVSEINDMILMVDKLIIEKLTSPQFKEKIGFANLKEVKDDIIKRSNIKSSLPKFV
jgi:hypothetical protein